MKSYRWTCNACNTGNDSNTTKCKQCGCPANASGEDIEKHKDPEAFRKNKAKESANTKYYKSLSSLTLFIPMAAGACLASGKWESLAIFLFLVVYLVVINIELLIYLWGNNWAKKMFIAFFSAYSILFLFRLIFINENSDGVYWVVLGMILLMAIQYFYFFVSERGKQLFNDFFESNYS